MSCLYFRKILIFSKDIKYFPLETFLFNVIGIIRSHSQSFIYTRNFELGFPFIL